MSRDKSFHIYVDGESHYTRMECFVKETKGEALGLGDLAPERPTGTAGWPITSSRLLVDAKSKFFWDCLHARLVGSDYPKECIDRAIYFTSFSGSEDDAHAARVRIREFGFEPAVVQERKDLADRRKHLLGQEGIIERAKGVDIGLAVRILVEDAYLGNFQSCLLFTSDIDFLPVIETIRRMGKMVFVAGFRSGLGANSRFEYVPDRFINLADRTEKVRTKAEAKEAP